MTTLDSMLHFLGLCLLSYCRDVVEMVLLCPHDEFGGAVC